MQALKYQNPDIHVLKHHVYEYRKGIRSLMLHTIDRKSQACAEALLQKKGLAYYIDQVSDVKINILFGNPSCVEVVKSFGKKKFGSFSPEEDFILGTLLGYNPCDQCQRFLKMKAANNGLKPCKAS